jgi:hypothetical protein
MISKMNYIRLPILVALLFGSVQPGANFFACTVRAHELATRRSCEDHCCKTVTTCESEHTTHTKETVKAKNYLPCCDSVIPFTSIAEQERNNIPHIILFVSSFSLFNSEIENFQITGGKSAPSPPATGKKILELNLRI